METRALAEQMAKRPYLEMTSVDETTDKQPIYFARVLEIEGCFGQGETHEQALEDLHLAMIDFIESLLVDGLPVPEPTRLVPTTNSTVEKSSLTFIGQGKKLKQKQVENHHDPYVLSVHA